MDTKKLAKLIKLIVEAEVAKNQEHFLTKIFPNILEEEVNAKMVKLLKETKRTPATQPQVEKKVIDPFTLAENILKKDRQKTQTRSTKEFTKNPILNQILNETQPFSSAQRTAGPSTGEGSSVLDRFSQPLNEASSHIPNYMDAEPDIDETMSFNSAISQVGLGSSRNQMAEKMGYGEFSSGASSNGLNVKTGVAELDKAFNRDYSELVKRFKK